MQAQAQLLQDLYTVGFRMTTLGWNESNPLSGSHLTGGGLTEQGYAYLKEAQRLGFVVDVSHISDEGFWDIIDITNKLYDIYKHCQFYAYMVKCTV